MTWLQKPKFQLSLCLHFWSAIDNDFKNLSSNFQSDIQGELSPPFDQQVTHWHLISKNLSLGVYTFWSGCLYLWVSQLFDQGVSTFWSACDTDFKNLSSNFHWWVVSIFWSASDNDFKNLSSNFQEGELSPPFDQQVTHWLQKPKFGCLYRAISAFWSGVNSLNLWVLFHNTTREVWDCHQLFDQGCHCCSDQQVTLTSKT